MENGRVLAYGPKDQVMAFLNNQAQGTVQKLQTKAQSGKISSGKSVLRAVPIGGTS